MSGTTDPERRPRDEDARTGPEVRAARVKAHARAEGFDLVGVAAPEAPVAWERYREAMDRGYGADMTWLYERPELRRDVREVHPEARSVVVVAMSYWTDTPGYTEQPPAEDEGWIARYAQGKDYHVHMRKRLVRLAQRFEADAELGHDSHAHRVFVDTGPVLEKAFAQQAGIGWIGKNSLLLNRDHGSWVFLGVVLTPLELARDEPEVDHCGTCRLCLDACPTDAFAAPRVLDARRCIAHWTIESRDPERDVDPETLGQHVFGCDICQEVCPWNRPERLRRRVGETPHAPLRPRPEHIRPKLDELAELDEESFRSRFAGTPVRRTRARHMRVVVDRIRGGSKG